MSSQQYPAWAYLLAGLVIGLFVSFLIYLQSLPVPEGGLKNQGHSNSKTKDTATPQFDFYKILPELEVVVPGLEVLNRKEARTQPKPPEPTVELAKGEKFILQVGSFKQFEQADKLKASLALQGIQANIQKVSVDGDTWHRVRIGPLGDRAELNTMRQRLQENQIQAITLKVSG